MKTQKTIMQQVVLLKKKAGWVLSVAVLMLMLVPAGTTFAQQSVPPKADVKETSKKFTVPQDQVSKKGDVKETSKKGMVLQESKSKTTMDRKIRATVIRNAKSNDAIIALRKNITILYKPLPRGNDVSFIPPTPSRSPAQQEAEVRASFPKIPSDERVVRNEKKEVPAGVEYLGKGYNVHIGRYAEADDLLAYVLDINALVDDGHVGRTRIPSSYDRYTSEENVSKYSQSTANSVGIEGSYGFFKGSVDIAWSKEQQREYGRSFASIMYKEKLYKLYINPAVDLRYYLTEDYKSALKYAAEKDFYEEIFRVYGTHVLLVGVMGGTLDYYVTTDYRYDLTQSSAQVNVEASFNSGFASAGVKVGTGNTAMTSDYQSSRDEKRITKPNFPHDWSYSKWFNFVERNAALIDFQDEITTGTGSFKILYQAALGATIFDTNGQTIFTYNDNTKYKRAYENLAKKNSFADPEDPPVIENCITGLALYKTTSGSLKTDGDPLESGGNSWKKINYIGGVLNSYYDSDVNYVLYTRTERTSASRPPIVQIYLTNVGRGENAYDIFRAKYADDPSAKLYTVPLFGQEPKQLINSASSPVYPGAVYGVNFNDVGRGRGDRIFLNYVTSTRLAPDKKPIRLVRFNKRDTGGYYVPGDYTVTFFTVMNSFGHEQDSAEGYRRYSDSSRKYEDVYGENYLQYSYEYENIPR